VVDLDHLYRRFEQATFSQREQIAGEVVAGVSPDELGPLLRGLDHPHRGVRLGVIEIVRRARYRAGLRRLMGHARNFDGDDRVFALRAMAQLAEPGDAFLAASVRGWLTSSDPFVQAHAGKIAATLALSRASAPAAAASEPGVAAEPLDKLVIGLFGSTRGAERVAHIDAIERRGPRDLMAAARLILQKGNADIVALVCRSIIRQAEVLPAPERLLPLLDAARRRLRDAPIASAAIDDALLALGANALSPSLLSRIDELDPAQLDALARRLSERPAGEIALHAPPILDALGREPALWSTLGPVLVRVAPDLRESARAELRRLVELLVDDLRRGKPLAPVTITSAGWVLARISEPGEPLSRQLCAALDGGAAEASFALAALCARLATEEAAVVLIAMLRDPLAEVRDAARAAAAAWQSPWVRIDTAAHPSIVHTYQDGRGQPLLRQGARLITATGVDDHVLDARGRPTLAGETEWGGCLCCSPPRALVRRRGEGLRCPSSWASHLREDGRTLLEKDHPTGRCRRCDSPRPRALHGGRPVCIDCGAGMPGQVDPDLAAPEDPAVPSEHGRARQHDDLPAPPTSEELEHVEAPIRAAITANVFLQARDGDQHWSGSGIIIARDGEHIAILTNRHVIEGDGERLCALKARTVSGETIRPTTIWRARRGVDLALVEGRVTRPDGLTVMSLGTGAALVGVEVFAIGNPLGLAWSYTAGTLSAVRHWRTRDGHSIRILQTDANMAPGSSGGGLFHRDGHLLGVISFSCQGHAGASAHFAISVDAIRAALTAEGVTWRGRPLADPPASPPREA
jgi:hypothetical protein